MGLVPLLIPLFFVKVAEWAREFKLEVAFMIVFSVPNRLLVNMFENRAFNG